MTNRAKDVAVTVASRFGAKAINLLVFLLIARTLPLEDVALYGFIFATSLLLSTVLDFGVRNSLAVFVGQDISKSDAYARQSFLIWLGVSICAVPLMYFALLASGYRADILRHTVPSTLLLVSMLYLRIMQGVLLGSGNISLFNRSELVSRAVLLTLTGVVYLWSHLNLTTAVWTLAVSQLVAAFYLFTKQYGSISSGRSVERSGLAQKMVRRGFMFMLTVLLMNAAQRLAFYIVGHFYGGDEAGLFFGLLRLTEIITEVGTAVSVVLFSHNVRTLSLEQSVQNTAQSMRICVAAFIFIGIAFASVSSVGVPLLLGPKFAGHSILFNLVLLSTIVGAIWTVLFPSLSVATSPQEVFIAFLPGLTIQALLLVPLMHRFNLEGAAVAMLCGNIVLVSSFLALYKKKFGVPPQDFLVVRVDDIRRVKRPGTETPDLMRTK